MEKGTCMSDFGAMVPALATQTSTPPPKSVLDSIHENMDLISEVLVRSHYGKEKIDIFLFLQKTQENLKNTRKLFNDFVEPFYQMLLLTYDLV